MLNPVLSICIPTYNRASFLDETLKNLTAQITNEVEVVISDDASTDNTEKIVAYYQKQFPNQIVYYKKNTNVRFDKNLITLIEKARGEYCWFISDDDLLYDGAVNIVLDELIADKSEKFLMLNYSKFDTHTGKIICDKMIDYPSGKLNNLNEFFFLPLPKSKLDYLGKNLIYISIFIFPRKYWLQSVKLYEKYLGINFIHCFVFLDILVKQHLSVNYIGEPFVIYRAGNYREWGNQTWLDYHRKFLSVAKKLGISKIRIWKIQISYFLKFIRNKITHWIKINIFNNIIRKD